MMIWHTLLAYFNTKLGLFFLILAFLILLIFLLSPLLFQTPLKKKASPEPLPEKPTITLSSRDIKAIAGEDIMATQLDLARAYIEMKKPVLAKKILEHVCEHGNSVQQHEAQQLLAILIS